MSSDTALLGGRYRLETVIGRGGMAEVWRARDERLGRPVAVKRLRADLASDPTFLARFRREAQSSAGLNHPNIVSTYDTGESHDPVTGLDIPYIVMELVTGHTLRDVLRDGRKILPERALQFVQGVLEALAYSHQHGIVHRDIKPANVMLTSAGQVKVMDFGIARAVADTSATMTQTAAVIGTAQYLSPEQARGETVDQRSDVYSAGCLLYELLVSRPPFVGDSPVSVAYQHVREAPVPPSQLDSELTPAMDAVTLKALAKDPDDRYQNASAMSRDIGRVLAGHQVEAVTAPTEVIATESGPATLVPGMVTATTEQTSVARTPEPAAVADEPDEPRKRSKLAAVMIALVVALVLALGTGAYYVMRPDPTPTVENVTVPTLKGMNQQQATTELVNRKLQLGTVTEINGDEATQDEVVDQDPAGQSTAPAGTKVNITINVGPQKGKIPAELQGKTEAQVTDALKKAGFTNIKRSDAPVNAETAAFNKGQVTAVNPAAGAEVPLASQVEILVATGMSTIPEVTNKTEEDAKKLLADAGFTNVKVVQVDGGTQGQVASVNPVVGNNVDKGAEVTLSVSKGSLTIPTGLLGLAEAEATQRLQAAGYVVRTQPAVQEAVDAVKGTVIDVDPPQGAPLDAGSQVTITIATGQSTVPNVRGKTVDEASKILTDAGFTVQQQTQTSTQAQGLVIDQAPSDGGRLDRGSTVTIVVSSGSTPQPGG